MELTPYVTALRDDLAAAASVGDEATTRAGSSLAAALEPAVRLTLMNALSDLAAEVTEALDGRTVDLRLQGREVKVVVGGDDARGGFAGPSSSPFVGGPGNRADAPSGPTPPPPPHEPPHHPGSSHDGPDMGDVSRMTLRIVDQIKGQAERAAAAQGMSLNSWVAQAVQGALRGDGGWGNWGGSGGGRWGGPGGGDGPGDWSGGWDPSRWDRSGRWDRGGRWDRHDDGGPSGGGTGGASTDSTDSPDSPGTGGPGASGPGTGEPPESDGRTEGS